MPESKKAATREKFAGDEYPIHVIGRHLDVTDAMKSYAVDKLIKVKRFGGRVIEATIVMDIQKLVHTVDFILNVNNTKIKVSGLSENMYVSVDQAIDHLEAKLRRYHKRLTDHHAKKSTEIEMSVNVIGRIPLEEDINDQIEEENLNQREHFLVPHPVVCKEVSKLKMLTQDEAVMKMELSGDVFLIYRSEEDQKLKVIYRRNDDNYGIIAPE